MPRAIPCENCGAALLEEVTHAGVRPVGADAIIPFRRNTDHVVCAECFESFEVRALIAKHADQDHADRTG